MSFTVKGIYHFGPDYLGSNLLGIEVRRDADGRKFSLEIALNAGEATHVADWFTGETILGSESDEAKETVEAINAAVAASFPSFLNPEKVPV